MSIIPEPLRSQIEAAALISPDVNIPNNDPVDDPTVEAGLRRPVAKVKGKQIGRTHTAQIREIVRACQK
ncbi:hypothetical protein NX774_19930 [Massilia agilis]|uniref:Uncharacterized protein n=1 Tax=Massilia agilis TaxID=1811226 RepID=A0ABT2DIA6_9BURK|nr:hypothetical protein [Massilia agilis]MCS0810198.1 hypothetical protein [Massilia agilis]